MYDDVDRRRQLLLDLCRVNRTLDQAGLENAAAGWKALEQQMVHEASVLLRSARHQPVLWSYQRDATSFKCRLQINDRSSSSVHQIRGRHLEDFLVEYTNKVNEYVFDEMIGSIDADEVVSFDVDGREINPYINEDVLKDSFMEATSNVDTDIIMEYADEAMSEVGVN